jgi:hypothetical protein
LPGDTEPLEEHLVVEAGTRESEGGRPRGQRLWFGAEQALAYPAARVSIQLGELGRDAAALGASTLVLDDLVARGGKPRPR